MSCKSLLEGMRPLYQHHFGVPRQVLDASEKLREHMLQGLQIVSLKDVLSADDIAIGFGLPNVFTLIPNGKTGDEAGHEKYSAYSLHRKDSEIVPTGKKTSVQSGYFVIPRNLPEQAKAAIVREVRAPEAQGKFWTCSNANCQVWERAGFTTGSAKPLSATYFPSKMLRRLLVEGLYYKGQPIEFDVVKTTPQGLKWFGYRQLMAEADTFRRHYVKAHPTHAWLAYLPDRWFWSAFAIFINRGNPEPWRIPTTPADPEAARTHWVNVSVSRPSDFGTISTQLFGTHNIYEVTPSDRAKIDDFLPKPLKEFERSKKDWFTTLKQRILFSLKNVARIRKHLIEEMLPARQTSISDLHAMLPVDTKENPAKYNLVVTPNKIDISYLNNGLSGLADWVLTKHVLVSGYDPDVRFAGVMWKGPDGTVYLSPDSGSYRPETDALDGLVPYMSAQFPGVKFVAVPYEPPAAKVKEPKRSLVQRAKDWAQRIKGLDFAMPEQVRLLKSIARESSSSSFQRIALSQLASLHPMDGVAGDKVQRRTEALLKGKVEIEAAGALTADLQDKLISSNDSMRAVRDRDGQLVIFGGNGRLKAIRQAFAENPNLEVEVEVFDFDTPNEFVFKSIDRIRRWRGLTPLAQSGE